jgi:multicomponent Na+:H+ antiporter subunit F
MMERILFIAGLLICFFMIATLFRAVYGPTILDRLIGVNAIGSKTTTLLIIIGLLYHRVDMFVDIALAYALLNFIAVLAASKFFLKRKGLHQVSPLED